MSLKEHAVRLPPADTLRIFRTCQSGWPSLTCSFSSSSGDCRSGAGFFVPEAGGANSAREQGANKGAGRGNGFGAACWRGRTKKQGIAGSKAPTRAPAAREKPARVGVAGRRNKALPGVRRQQGRRPRGKNRLMLAWPDEETRHCREKGANKGAGRPGKTWTCWRGRTKKQGIAGSKAPTWAPAAREKPARVGVAGRRNKASPGARRQQRRRPRGTLIHVAFRKAEEIDDETLFAEVPSSISSRPPGGLE